MRKKLLGTLFLCLLAVPAMAQIDDEINPIITAMPSLSITPDARAGGLGGVGAATSPDLNSQHWNPAKYAFMESHGGITASYTPWLRKLVSDINLAHIAGYYKWDDLQGISASFTYFSLGDVQLTDQNGGTIGNAHPNEWALDVAYSRKLHEYVSMAVALRFMMSDLNNGASQTGVGYNSTDYKVGWTMAADIALYYKQPIELSMGMSYFTLGFNLSNLGGKISYTEDNDMQSFIPTNMRLGVGYELPFDDYNSLSFFFDVNKLMVPTIKSKYAKEEDGNMNGRYSQENYSKISPIKGWFQSFADAPGGVKEEFQELQFGGALEYSYSKKFFARVGYSHESKQKGNRRFFTFGAGFHLSIFSLDAAYYLATHSTNPLDQTFQVTLGFDLAGIKDLVNK